MFSPRSLLVITLTLMIGGIVGRVTAPKASSRAAQLLSFKSQSPETGFPLRVQNAASALASNDPGTSRAIVDVTPGPDKPATKPIPALSELLRMNNWARVFEFSSRFADTLDEEGIRRAMEQVRAAPETISRVSLRGALMRRWAELDLLAAIEYARSDKTSSRLFGDRLISRVMYGWAQNDPAAAKVWADGLPEGKEKQHVMGGILNALAEKEPDQAFQMMLNTPKASNEILGYGYQLFSGMAQRNAADAARKVMLLPPGQLRSQGIQIIAGQWATFDPKAAAQWAVPLPAGESQRHAFGGVLSTWARTDPKVAAAYAQGIESDSTRCDCIMYVASSWSQTDPASAMDWMKTLPDDSSRSSAVGSILSNWSRTDSDAAAAYVLKLKEDPKYGDYLQSLRFSWDQHDLQGALKWAQKQSDPKVEQNFTAEILTEWTSYEPEKAAAQVKFLKDPQAKKQAMENVARQWSVDAPEKAMTWLVSLPAGEDRDSAMRNAVANWTRSKPADVATRLGRLPEGATRDAMISSFADNVAQNNPEAATAWAFSISDDKKRDSAASDALKKWSQTNRFAATNWVNQQNFTLEDRAKYLGLVQPKK